MFPQKKRGRKQKKKRQKEIRHSVEAMLKDAKKVAEGKASYYTLQEVFGEKGEK